MISYLIETTGKEKLIEILQNTKQLDSCRNNLLLNSIKYYNDKYELNVNGKRK